MYKILKIKKRYIMVDELLQVFYLCILFKKNVTYWSIPTH